ncbi:MAG: MoaD/ThiS family protein [Propionivibrio sp.]|nr:MoaD/ThiS family protein [Propionivibrio sp.]MBP6709726.1 MoaD/ThiS family protein [Propionivibrio sp.]MBP7524140.1 MoaD/ThiS family protein [Propionivibrio sp.]MBP8163723.1 MoaD/ThiS family protein [Propionivibrio sp.]
MRVLIPGALLSYTGQNWVEAAGATVGDVIDDLEARYPGIRFRMVDEQGNIRRHMRMFFDSEMVLELSQALRDDGELLIVQALSGG